MEYLVRTMIKFPYMRINLISSLQLLADEMYQAKYWGSEMAHTYFDDAVHLFFDDTPLSEGGAKCIGEILEDENEAVFSDSICTKINLLLEAYGYDKPDEFYVKTREWREIVRDAQQFLGYMNESLAFKDCWTKSEK